MPTRQIITTGRSSSPPSRIRRCGTSWGLPSKQQSKFHSARQAYTNATRLDKNFAEAWNNIGTVLFMEKKYGKSVKYYQRAIELKSDNASFHMNLGTSYYHLKKFDEAVEEYRTALGIDPKVVLACSPPAERSSTPAKPMWNSISTWPKPSLPSATRRSAVRYLRRALEDGFNKPEAD